MSPTGLVIVTIVSKLVISCYFTFFSGIYNLLLKGLGWNYNPFTKNHQNPSNCATIFRFESLFSGELLDASCEVSKGSTQHSRGQSLDFGPKVLLR